MLEQPKLPKGVKVYTTLFCPHCGGISYGPVDHPTVCQCPKAWQREWGNVVRLSAAPSLRKQGAEEERERLRSAGVIEQVSREIDVFAPDERWMRRKLVTDVLDKALTATPEPPDA